MLQGAYNIKDKLTKHISTKNTNSTPASSTSKSSSTSKQKKKHEKQEIAEMKKNHKSLDEELRPLTFVHAGVK